MSHPGDTIGRSEYIAVGAGDELPSVVDKRRKVSRGVRVAARPGHQWVVDRHRDRFRRESTTSIERGSLYRESSAAVRLAGHLTAQLRIPAIAEVPTDLERVAVGIARDGGKRDSGPHGNHREGSTRGDDRVAIVPGRA